MNNSTLSTDIEEVKYWSFVLDRLQLSLSMMGAVANITTLFILYKYISTLSSGVRLLLKHQSFIDALSCVIAAILLVEKPFWRTGLLYLDVIVCHCWQGQAMYWGCIYLSALNLILISLERYIAVVKPFSHNCFISQYLKKCVCMIYVIAITIIMPSFMQTRFDFDIRWCLSEYAFEAMNDLFYFYSIVWLFMTYLVPVSLFMGLYSKIIMTLRSQSQHFKVKDVAPPKVVSNRSTTSQSLKSAHNKMTKAAICITSVYILTLGFDSWYYALGYTKVTKYEFGSKIQKIGVFLAVLNSVINPFIYAVLMPKFRVCYIALVTNLWTAMVTCSCRVSDSQNISSPAVSVILNESNITEHKVDHTFTIAISDAESKSDGH